MPDNFIPFHRPSIGEDEIREVVDTLRSGWLTTGPRTKRFESEFRDYVGASYAVALNSATAALHLALAALNLGPGDEVITSPMTFCATVQAILHVGAVPVLADILPDGNIDPEEIARRITSRTRAILPVHLAGLPCQLEAIHALAREHGLFVVEDAAHAAGARYRGRPIGAGPSDAVAFSFYATKNLTTGEGGMLTTPRADMAETVRMLSLHGTTRDAWDRYSDHGGWHYDVVAHGFKYNLSDVQSAIGIHQLHQLDRFILRRAEQAAAYHRELAATDCLDLPADRSGCRHAWHLYIIRLNLDRLKIDRDEFICSMRRKGVGTSVHFIPIPLHPFFASLPLAGYSCPRAEELYPRIVSLPLYPALTDEQIHYIAQSVREVLERSRRPQFVASGPVEPGGAQCGRPPACPSAEGALRSMSRPETCPTRPSPLLTARRAAVRGRSRTPRRVGASSLPTSLEGFL
jgi:dTDP-4-amino-4,6-dideoxygalactose transaminase